MANDHQVMEVQLTLAIDGIQLAAVLQFHAKRAQIRPLRNQYQWLKNKHIHHNHRQPPVHSQSNYDRQSSDIEPAKRPDTPHVFNVFIILCHGCVPSKHTAHLTSQHGETQTGNLWQSTVTCTPQSLHHKSRNIK